MTHSTRSSWIRGGLVLATLLSACTDDAPAHETTRARAAAPPAAECALCRAETFTVTAPVPAPAPPTPAPRVEARLAKIADAVAAPELEAADAATEPELEEGLMTIAALSPAGSDCLRSGGVLAPTAAVARQGGDASLTVTCDCGGAR